MAEREPGVVATGEESVRSYLSEQGMTEGDISKYVGGARSGPGPAQFSFGSDEVGLIPRYSLSHEGETFVLLRQEV
jgi:hypothetical protein